MTVYLVGAGPGDPGLMTVRGLELVRRCDVLVHDRLVADAVVDEAPRRALRVPRDGTRQEELNRLLVDLGRTGLEIVRLKGGDPFVFGRGGEEALALARAGVPFDVVPGVSSAAAVPAAAGIPITHRGVADRVTLVTAHGADDDEPDWEALAAVGGTLVLFMGLGRAGAIARGLVGAGLAAETPAAIVSRGTLPDETHVLGTLEQLPSLAIGLPSPALVVVGEVVALAEALGATATAVAAAA